MPHRLPVPLPETLPLPVVVADSDVALLFIDNDDDAESLFGKLLLLDSRASGILDKLCTVHKLVPESDSVNGSPFLVPVLQSLPVDARAVFMLRSK